MFVQSHLWPLALMQLQCAHRLYKEQLTLTNIAEDQGGQQYHAAMHACVEG